jgi:MoxR-like ATPase
MSYPVRFQLLLIALILAVSFSCVQGQGRGVNAERTRAIERAEMDRLLLWAVPKAPESEATRLSRFKKIKDDFRDLQSLNNKMMSDAWLQDALDYSSIADMISKIRGKANDLKSSLALPVAEKPETPAKLPTGVTVRQFREGLLLLDKTIMRFVTNPVFQAANTLDIDQAKKASSDLEGVISLTDDLKQSAQKLRKATH